MCQWARSVQTTKFSYVIFTHCIRSIVFIALVLLIFSTTVWCVVTSFCRSTRQGLGESWSSGHSLDTIWGSLFGGPSIIIIFIRRHGHVFVTPCRGVMSRSSAPSAGRNSRISFGRCGTFTELLCQHLFRFNLSFRGQKWGSKDRDKRLI